MRWPSLVVLSASIACTTPTTGGDGGAVADGGPTLDGLSYPDATPVSEFRVQFVDPDFGPFAGGTEVLVRGDGFTEDSRVFFGGRMVEPLDQELVDSRRLIVRTPPGEPGMADVEVRKSNQVALLETGYRYEPIMVDPPTGSVAGNTFVTITGYGTDFDASTAVRFDGVEVVGVTIINENVLTAYTPPGVAGTANVRVTTQTGLFEAEKAYTYQSTGDPFFGGMSGGPINGAVNVVVIDTYTDNGVDNAFVVLGDPATSSFKGFADNLGQITFSDPSLAGPITVTAMSPGYEMATFMGYDAANITIFLRGPPPEPSGGPFPPPPQVGHIFGHVMFGDAVGLGSPHWGLVPEPRTSTEVKRIYVTTTASNAFSSAYAPQYPIDYQGFDPNKTAWEFDVFARPRAMAVVAIAGLYDSANDPSGTGVSGFQPFAMGITRGVLVGAGENVMNVDIIVNIPLDTTVEVDLVDPPALDTPDWPGPVGYTIRPFIDLGGEGVIAMNKNFLSTPPFPEPAPNVYDFPPGTESILLPGFAPLSGPLADASYSFIVGAYSSAGGNPFSVRVVRGVTAVSFPISIGDFIGVSRPSDPTPGGLASSQSMRFYSELPAAGEATFNLHTLTDDSGGRLARIITRGDILDTPIYDLSQFGFEPFPSEKDVTWQLWRIKVAGTFDQFTYRQLGSLYWDAYTADAWWAVFP